MMNRRTHFGLVCILIIVLLIPNAIVMAYERDLHYDGVYALLKLSGIKDDDALWTARASQSLDENAETSPMPEVAAKKSPWWFERTSMWHSLPPHWLNRPINKPEDMLPVTGQLLPLTDEQYVLRRLVDLYARARDEKDSFAAKIYFGQYLHVLADSISHRDKKTKQSYGSIIGHFLKGYTPDIPGPLAKNETLLTAHILVGEIARFQRERFHETPERVPAEYIQAVVAGLKYAAPSDKGSIEKREEVARQHMEQELHNAGVQIKIPKWVRGASEIPFDGEGKVKVGFIDKNGKENDKLVIPPQDWEKLITKERAPKAVEAALAPLGLRQPEVGGIDFSNVRLNYLVDVPAPGGGRTFALGLEPDSSGKGGDIALAISAFAAAIMLPDPAWWVNLNPAEPHRIIDPLLGQTDAGRVMLEADFLLKDLADEVIRPGTPIGDAHWREFFRSSIVGSFRGEKVAEWRTWIVPGECRARVAGNEIEIIECHLDVRMNLEAFATAPLVGSPSESAMRREEIRLRETYILPALRRAVNEDPRFGELRAVFRSRALAQAYKDRLRDNGALVRLVDSLDLKGFPVASRRDPRQIWQGYADEYRARRRELRVMSPFGDGRYVAIQSGGVVFDDVALTAAHETEILATAPPVSPRLGLLMASTDVGTQGVPASGFIQSALAAYRASPLSERSLPAAADLLPALAFAKSPEYDTVRREIARNTEADILIASADGLRTGAPAGDPLTDTMPFAVWSRLEPRAAAKLVSVPDLPPLRLFSYAFATIASPRVGDPPAGQLMDWLINSAATLTPEKRVNNLVGLAYISSVVAPRATDRIIEELMSDKLKGALPGAAKFVVLTAKNIAVFDVQKAARLHLALRDALEAAGHRQNPEIDDADLKLINFVRYLAQAEDSTDPAANARLARIQWLSDPGKGIDRATKVVDALAARAPSRDRDEALAIALPIFARLDPLRAASVAKSIGDPIYRMSVLAVIAMRAIDPIASDLLLAQTIVQIEAPN